METLMKSLQDLALKPNHEKLEFKAKEMLVLLLTSLMTTPHSKDMVPVQAAACLCYINSGDQNAIEYLTNYLHNGDTFQKKQVLEVVIRHLGIHETFPIQVLLKQIQTSPIFKHRLKPLDLLVTPGTPQIIMAGMYQAVLEVLKKKLWDDPVLAVSQRAALVVNMLGMKKTMWEDLEQQLEENEAVARGRAVISLSFLGLASRRVLQTLLEMLETDYSQHVRLQIIRSFARLHLKDVQVKQGLLNHQLGEGPLAR
ncbi:protein HEATR9-like isoform X2 [Narcine bancroftii]